MVKVLKLLKNTTIAAVAALSIGGCNNPPKEADFENLSPQVQELISESMRTGKYEQDRFTRARMVTFYRLIFANGSYFEAENGNAVEFLSEKEAQDAMQKINEDLISQGHPQNLLITEIKSYSGLKPAELDEQGNTKNVN